MIRTVGQRKSERGTTLVEFALSTVLLLTVLLGIIDVGRVLYSFDWVSDAARRGARWAMVRGSSCQIPGSPPTSCSANSSAIQTYVESNAFGIQTNSSYLTVTSICTVNAAGGSPPSSSPPCAPGYPVQVTVQYTMTYTSPFAPVLVPPWTMTSTSQMVVSQ